ncbi:inositol-tetrakisphosphate 1-kinase [Plakobranchus ocellatus]|uniref:Inositol-tetrakisphosphate 1-kinase n=1 Tax=Plakobranchus ocellatus TaxID=259542 RepID=A0AAV4CTK2_9GAST|nr:inositol-tetrakisphosphate 1-kinase [Plakobranchus ocellatus]
MRRVGYWISEKKRKKIDFKEQQEMFRCAGIELVEIDLKQSMEAQGPFDLIIHKVTDILARANDGHVSSQNAIANLEGYLKTHPACVVMDPLDSIRRLLNRYTQYRLVVDSDIVKDRRCTVPTFVDLHGTDIEENKERLAQADVTFPLVCKPMLAHGSLAHQMSIIFNEEHLSDINPPCVVQSFINHNALLYKVFVVGCKQFITQRPSLKNLYPGNLFSLYSEENHPGIKVGGQNINNLRYADDTVLIAENKEDLQKLLNIVEEESRKKGLELNSKKTDKSQTRIPKM